MSTMTKALHAALQELRVEKDRIESAISELETLIGSLGGGKRRGRPPGSSKRGPGRPAGAKKKVRKNWSAAARKAAALRMKKYWAERKKQG